MAHARLPAVHRLLSDPRLTPYELLVGRDALKRSIDAVLEDLRSAGAAPEYERIVERIATAAHRDATHTLMPAINATGVLLHTNLGRAPVSAGAFEEAAAVACGYSNVEYDLETGSRGSRYAHAHDAIADATGAADSIVVNNCAAAVLLILDTFARDREVIVGRNQLIEIGGGFRIPDVLARSGARLVEAGTTNKVRASDIQGALSPRTTLLLRTHQSNFSASGFVEDVSPRELVAIGRKAGVPVAEDLGSGALVPLEPYGLPHERTVREAVGDGVDLVAFSGDKLLGGPQAGIIVGTPAAVARLRANPLLRALRVDKITLALLAATLRLYRCGAERERIPFFAMLAQPLELLRERAERIAAAGRDARAIPITSLVGGGSLSQATIASYGVALDVSGAEALAARLRSLMPPVIARIEDGKVVLDLRTVAPEQDAYLAKVLE